MNERNSESNLKDHQKRSTKHNIQQWLEHDLSKPKADPINQILNILHLISGSNNQKSIIGRHQYASYRYDDRRNIDETGE